MFCLVSCGETPKPASPGTDASNTAHASVGSERANEAAIRANLAKLSPEDQKLAAEQRYCAIESEHRLGGMGTPYKIMLQDQPVFLCCKGCVKRAETRPEQTLATVKRLRAVSGTGSPAEKPLASTTVQPQPRVAILRVPHGGIQPQVVVDAREVVHLIYFQGDPGHGDVFYVRSTDGGQAFSQPLRVNSTPGSAIAIGNIRGAHLALGKNGRLHVAWNGTDKAEPRGPGNAHPMLYTRSNEEGIAFEPERNVMRRAYGLDGGGSVAADQAGNVFVAWHAPEPGKQGEENRRVWVAHSADEGKSFASEQPAFAEATGACGCCGLRTFADHNGTVYLLYRSAIQHVNRDMYLLTSTDHGKTFRGEDVGKWEIGGCPMSSAAFAEGSGSTVAAWETNEQVYFTRIELETGKHPEPVAAPGDARGRKHPAVAVGSGGETILVWTEGMGWNKGGSVAWQVYDKAGQATSEKGSAEGVPTWSLVAVFARPAGGFTVLY
jgi:hypothetical protein